MRPTYYNLWDVDFNIWADCGRRTNGTILYQSNSKPWLLSLEEVIEWLRQRYAGCYKDDILTTGKSIIEINTWLSSIGSIFLIQEVENPSRQQHALKYL